MHVDGDVFGNDFFEEGHEALGDATKHEARIASTIDVCELQDEIRRAGDSPAHGRQEELLFRVGMPQEGGGRDAELAGDVCKSGRFKSLRGEDAPRCVQQFLSRDPRRPAHL